MPTAASQLRTPNVARDRLPHLLPFLTINNDKLQFYNVPVNWHWTDPAIGTGAGGGIINGPCESSSNNGGILNTDAGPSPLAASARQTLSACFLDSYLGAD